MDTASIVAELEAERDRLNRAIAALRGSTNGRRTRKESAVGPTNGRKRHMSAAARQRISIAMKKKWAARKKGA
jgi:hypothetical protein